MDICLIPNLLLLQTELQRIVLNTYLSIFMLVLCLWDRFLEVGFVGQRVILYVNRDLRGKTILSSKILHGSKVSSICW